MNGRIDLFWADSWLMFLPPGLRIALIRESSGAPLANMELTLAVRLKQDMRPKLRRP
jgi:hypothetical protein